MYRLTGPQRYLSNGFFAVREIIRRSVQINRTRWRNEESFDSRPRQGIFLVFTISRLVLETIQPACPEEKRPGHTLFIPLHIPTCVELHLTYLLTPWSRVLLQRLIVSQLVKKFLDFLVSEGSLPRLQLPATCHQIIHSTPPHPTSWRSILILSSHLHRVLPSGFFPSGFATKTLYTPLLSPIRATWPAHLILLDFITRTILGEEGRSLSSSLCSFFHSPVTSSLLGRNILLNTLFSNTHSLRSFLNVSDQVSHPYKTGKIGAASWVRNMEQGVIVNFVNRQIYLTAQSYSLPPVEILN